MQWHIVLHMHGDNALKYECMVNESTLHLVFDWWARLNGATSNRVAWLSKVAKKICVEY